MSWLCPKSAPQTSDMSSDCPTFSSVCPKLSSDCPKTVFGLSRPGFEKPLFTRRELPKLPLVVTSKTAIQHRKYATESASKGKPRTGCGHPRTRKRQRRGVKGQRKVTGRGRRQTGGRVWTRRPLGTVWNNSRAESALHRSRGGDYSARGHVLPSIFTNSSGSFAKLPNQRAKQEKR